MTQCVELSILCTVCVRVCALHRGAPADGRRKEEVETRAAAPQRSSSQPASQSVGQSGKKKSLRSCGRLVSPPSLLHSFLPLDLRCPVSPSILLLNVDVWGYSSSSPPSRLRNKPRFSRRPCTFPPSFLPPRCRSSCDRLVLHIFKHGSCSSSL